MFEVHIQDYRGEPEEPWLSLQKQPHKLAILVF